MLAKDLVTLIVFISMVLGGIVFLVGYAIDGDLIQLVVAMSFINSGWLTIIESKL